MLKMDDRVVAKSDLLSTEIESGVVLMDAASGNYFNFRDVAAEIWRQLAEPRSLQEICQRLDGIYDAPPERIRTSVQRFLNDLCERKLIRLV